MCYHRVVKLGRIICPNFAGMPLALILLLCYFFDDAVLARNYGARREARIPHGLALKLWVEKEMEKLLEKKKQENTWLESHRSVCKHYLRRKSIVFYNFSDSLRLSPPNANMRHWQIRYELEACLISHHHTLALEITVSKSIRSIKPYDFVQLSIQ